MGIANMRLGINDTSAELRLPKIKAITDSHGTNWRGLFLLEALHHNNNHNS